MDCRSPPRLKLLIAFLHVSTNIVYLHGNPTTGVNHNLRCVSDYLFTINCSLSIAPSENCSDSNSSYWLTFTETYEEETFVCLLTNTNGEYFCSLQTFQPMPDEFMRTFVNSDTYEISLCHKQKDGSESCDMLDDDYAPVTSIKPNAPCCLTVSHNASQHHFTWRSTYEEYAPFTGLVDNLMFQLQNYKRGDKHKELSHKINTNIATYSEDDENFVPDTKYAARVRTSPDQSGLYKGQWSDWSPEVYWETESAADDLPSNTFVSGLVKVLIPLGMIPFILLFCYAPIKRWRQSAFIPTPAPYFHTLYSDCKGDFKSWVVTHENMAEMLKEEETLQIDTLTKCAVVEEEECQLQFHHQFMEGSAYSNITDPGCDASLLGIPYAVSTMAPPSSPGSSLGSLTLSSQPGSPTEGDSGCWLEGDPPWYCNEYCTLSTFQQSSPIIAEHHGKPPKKSCPTGIRVEVITEA